MTTWAAKRFLANDSAPAGQFEPVDPAAVHPVIDRGATDSGCGNGAADWKELRFLVAVFAKKMARGQAAHHNLHAAIRSGTARIVGRGGTNREFPASGSPRDAVP
jgi:hypothetical protein